jgi:hypothetical protein
MPVLTTPLEMNFHESLFTVSRHVKEIAYSGLLGQISGAQILLCIIRGRDCDHWQYLATQELHSSRGPIQVKT